MEKWAKVLLTVGIVPFFFFSMILLTFRQERDKMPVAEALINQDLEAVSNSLKSLENPNLQDSRGNPPLLIAAATAQFRAANLLLDANADIWATDRLGFTPASAAYTSRVLEDSIEGKARAIFIERLKQSGYPWPPPNPVEVMELRDSGQWPPQPRERR